MSELSPSCPCQSGNVFAECCEPIILGQPAGSPERLMRSRYTAFSNGNAEYLLRSWHPSTRPSELDIPANTHWYGLTIIESNEQGDNGRVTFKARFKENAEWFELSEASEFARHDQDWKYVYGHAEFLPLKPGRNDLCLCGSERKWKKCCG